MSDQSFEVEIRAKIDQLQKGMAQATVSLEKFQRKAKSTGDSTTKAFDKIEKAGARLQSAGIAMTAGVTAPLVGLAAVAVKTAGDFDAAMTGSVAIMSDVTAEIRDEMERTADVVASTTKFSSEEAAESYFFLASAGLSAVESIKALPVVAEFAQAGLFDMARATDLLTDSASALGLEVEEYTRLSDVLVKANTIANASVEQFAESLTTKAAAQMRSMNIEVEEGVAVLAAFADQGVKGRLAGERFDILLRNLTQAAIDQKDAFAEANVSVFEQDGSLQNLGTTIGQLEQSMSAMSEKQKIMHLDQLGFNVQARSTILLLLGMSGGIKDYEAALRDAGGTAARVAETQMGAFNMQMLLIADNVAIAIRPLGEALIPMLKSLADNVLMPLIAVVKVVAEWFKKLDTVWQVAIVAVGALAAAIGPVMLVLGLLAQSVMAVVGVFGLMGGAAAVLGTALAFVKGALLVLLPAAAVLGLAFVSWKLVERAEEANGLGTAIERFAARMMGATDDVIEHNIAQRELGTQNDKNTGLVAKFKDITQQLRDALKEEKDAAEEAAAAVENLGVKSKWTAEQKAALREKYAQLAVSLKGMEESGRESGDALLEQANITRQLAEETEETTTKIEGLVDAEDILNKMLTERAKSRGLSLDEYLKKLEEVRNKTDEVAEETVRWNDILKDLRDSMEVFGVSAESAFSKVVAGLISGFTFAERFAEATNNAQKAMIGLSAASAAFESGSALGGAATGAAFGAQFGAAGAVVGGVVGGVLGLFGGNKKKEQEEAERKQRQQDLLADFDAIASRIDDLTQRVVSDGINGLGAVFQWMGTQTDLTAERMDHMGVVGMAMFQSLRDQGLTMVEAMEAMGPALDAALEAATEQGVELTGQFAELAAFRERVLDNAPLVSAAEGMAAVLNALAIQGSLTQETFDGMQQEAGAMFDELIAKGFTSNQSLAMMAPFLKAADEAAARYGLQLDETTRALFDQSDAAGHLDALKTPQEEMIEVQQLMLQTVAALTAAFGGTLPAAVQEYIDALNEIPDIPGPPSTGQQGNGGSGGKKGDSGQSGFFAESLASKGFAGGERPFTLHEGEGALIVPRGQGGITGALTEAVGKALAAGGGGGGGPQQIVVQIGDEVLARAIESGTKSGTIRVHVNAVEDF